MTVRNRILAGFFIVTLFSFSTLMYWILQDLKPQYRKVTEEPLIDTSRILASLAATTYKDGKIDTKLFRQALIEAKKENFEAGLFDFVKDDIDFRIYITDALGIVVFDSSGVDEGKDYSEWNDVYLTLRGEYGARTSHENSINPKTSTMYIAAPIKVKGEIVGVLSVGNPTDKANLFVENAKSNIFLGGFLTAIAAILLSILISGRITIPIKKLTDYAKIIRDGGKTPLPTLSDTETRELGEAFENMREALEGKNYVEKYIQTLTHEIKSPLSAIRGAAELLTEKIPEEQQEKFIANIMNESGRIETVIEKLLLLASLENIESSEDVRPVDLGDMVAEVIKSSEPQLKQKSIKINYSSLNTNSSDSIVEADPFLIRQAISNLLQNSIDFSPEGSTIESSIESTEGTITYIVKDSGGGIPDYAKDKVFDRFYSIKRPTTGKKSSGLGLCLVKEVALLHRGSVILDDSTDSSGTKGTTASITIPRKQK